jgi:hypothetical protein
LRKQLRRPHLASTRVVRANCKQDPDQSICYESEFCRPQTTALK